RRQRQPAEPVLELGGDRAEVAPDRVGGDANEPLLILRSISTGPVERLISATVESSTGRSSSDLTTMRPRSVRAWRYGSSSCTTTLYWLPVRGSVKIEGWMLAFEFSENSTVSEMVRCESLTEAAFS